jgi:hypothetical protein
VRTRVTFPMGGGQKPRVLRRILAVTTQVSDAYHSWTPVKTIISVVKLKGAQPRFYTRSGKWSTRVEVDPSSAAATRLVYCRLVSRISSLPKTPSTTSRLPATHSDGEKRQCEDWDAGAARPAGRRLRGCTLAASKNSTGRMTEMVTENVKKLSRGTPKGGSRSSRHALQEDKKNVSTNDRRPSAESDEVVSLSELAFLMEFDYPTRESSTHRESARSACRNDHLGDQGDQLEGQRASWSSNRGDHSAAYAVSRWTEDAYVREYSDGPVLSKYRLGSPGTSPFVL